VTRVRLAAALILAGVVVVVHLVTPVWLQIGLGLVVVAVVWSVG